MRRGRKATGLGEVEIAGSPMQGGPVFFSFSIKGVGQEDIYVDLNSSAGAPGLPSFLSKNQQERCEPKPDKSLKLVFSPCRLTQAVARGGSGMDAGAVYWNYRRAAGNVVRATVDQPDRQP